MDSLSERSSSVHGDDAARPLNFGFDFNHDDQQGGMHDASQPEFTLPSMYSRVPERSVPTAAQPASPASNNYSRQGVLTLGVDRRASLVPGMHACVDALADVFLEHAWGRVYAFPPCTHQTLSDRRSGEAKCLDGHAFWGILFFVACWCIECEGLMLEQPDTIIPDLFLAPTQRLRASEVGDPPPRPGVTLLCGPKIYLFCLPCAT